MSNDQQKITRDTKQQELVTHILENMVNRNRLQMDPRVKFSTLQSSFYNMLKKLSEILIK